MDLALILSILFLSSATYAVLLHRTQGYGFEPAYTWVKVVLGCSLCLLALGVYVATNDLTTWQAYGAAWAVFVAGGMPIIAWQIWLDVRRRNREMSTMRRLITPRTERAHETSASATAAPHQSND